ncbi:RHTO0S11e03708g1_1 [Rhodotorula toruloides]|uniref:RHTO0S11e03708g1_1 n=2 Tax=Rhodotorula toruloides TaxID=5286 RepID=A0A061B8N1_RHOTO|nr:uncharacterized protein RHTO_01700 [Rhodotorula toruloides NP11]EMS21640.1 hypothetical protein RHTO_01700 [Rhodotorula toruloides NP11]CDR45728.1 RHTO0S11e03708g1_1 [Rhodotorula toruloides]
MASPLRSTPTPSTSANHGGDFATAQSISLPPSLAPSPGLVGPSGLVVSNPHTRSASLPLASPGESPHHLAPNQPRQLPPGAGYAPDNLHRPNASVPAGSSLPSRGPAAMVGAAQDASNGPWRDGDARPGMLRVQSSGLDTVTEGTSGSSTAGGPMGGGAERGEVHATGQGWQAASTMERPPMLLPNPPIPVTHISQPQEWFNTLQQPTPPPSQNPAPSQSDGYSTPRINYSRPYQLSVAIPSGQHSSATPSPQPSPVDSRNGPVPPPLRQRTSFVGVPGGRGPSSTRAAADAAERASNIPSFVPAPAFSVDDRGPYPPHLTSPTRVVKDPFASCQNGDEGEYLARPATSAPRVQPHGMATEMGRPGSLAFDFGSMPDDMAGVGRNSVIRAATSPAAATGPSLSQNPPPPLSPPRSLPPPTVRSPQIVAASQQALSASAQQGQTGVSYAPTSPALASPAPLIPSPAQLNSPAAVVQQALPPHLTPQPEICVECMMRDRDMADVDVTGPGVWERASDADFEEQMRWEMENPTDNGSWSGDHAGGAGGGSLESGHGSGRRRGSGAAYSRESVGGRSSNNHGMSGRRRLGKGQLLTSGNLKVLTTMNPPASSHRWRTLQTYLATQIHLLDLERQAREAAGIHHIEPPPIANTRDVRLSVQSASTAALSSRNRSSSLLSPASLAAEKAALEQEERQARVAKAQRQSRVALVDETNRHSSASLFPPSIAPPQPPFALASSGSSMRSYSTGDQPWLGNQLRRFSSSGTKDNLPPKSPAASTASNRFAFPKFARSTTDLRSVGTPRSISPARTSVGRDDRRTSMWSRFRQSASASVLSFAPSGSMMDMHLGLSQDKHMPYAHPPYDTYPSMSDPAVARHADRRERDRVLAVSGGNGVVDDASTGKKKKKGLKGFLNKLVGGGKKVNTSPAPERAGFNGSLALDGSYGDDDELAPPPPLSALVNEPRYHQRSASNSSIDSFGPYTPPLHPAQQFRTSYAAPLNDHGSFRSAPADRQSIMTMGSYISTRSKPAMNGGGSQQQVNGYGRPSLDSLGDQANSGGLPRSRSSEPHLVDSGEPEVLAIDGERAPTPHDFAVNGVSPHPSGMKQKSLPLLPSDAMNRQPAFNRPFESYSDPSTPLSPPNAPYASNAGSRSAYSLDPSSSQSNFVEEFGCDGHGGRDRSATVTGNGQTVRKSRSRSKVFSMNFGAFGKKKTASPDVPPLPSPQTLRGASLDAGYAMQGDLSFDARQAAFAR